jgi:hypothetical protein
VTHRDDLDPAWAFTTPPGRDHARFLLFNGENDSTLGTWMPSPAGTHLDAVRFQRKALTTGEVLENWDRIQSGEPSPPTIEDSNGNGVPDELEGPKFHRGDANDDGKLEVSDAARLIDYLLRGGAGPTCRNAADSNGDGRVDISDAISVLNFLFRDGPAPSLPGPPGSPCGLDPDPPDSGKNPGCAAYASC